MKQQTSDERIKFLEDKIKILEDENVETTNCLYEMENRLQSQIDALINYTMKFKQWEGEPNDIY
jgi:prefoldin subunit 5